MKKYISLLILLLIGFICIYIYNFSKETKGKEIRKLEKSIMELSYLEDTTNNLQYLFDDTINNSDIINLPKGYISI